MVYVQKIWSNPDYDYNEAYEDQLEKFVRFVEEGRLKHRHDASSAVKTIRVVEALFESNSSGKRVNIVRNERFSF